MTITRTYEKMGLLYLGRELDMNGVPAGEAPFLYKNKDLTTHGIIIGMTGSGKTGLGIDLIEEVSMDGVPSIIIDPKGDMGNLMLTFPECRAEDFQPWVDPTEATRRELSVEAFAERTATQWREGLSEWGEDLSRIGELRRRTEVAIYTPGSSAGLPVSVLSSFEAPSQDVMDDADTLHSMVSATVTSLLALIGVRGDPLQSREHILLSSLLLHHWRRGESPNMERLIGDIVSPPFDKVGVFPLESFYPQSERMKLAVALNNIIASPGFAAWMQGEPLDIQHLLYSSDGRPRTVIFSISHLTDDERMFFVTMLLNAFIGWMRRQQGASSLKALLYMDEIFGYFPPTANPPSKKPMMMLLKQARAFGVGVVLATQNPVDLDYRGLANIGSWFVGRLQTRQDQDRVVEGIVGASDGNVKTVEVRRMLASMKGRQFLLNSVYLEEPVLFETRWVMSYLKGPMSKNDIRRLMKNRQVTESLPPGENRPSMTASRDAGSTGMAPVFKREMAQRYHLASPVEVPDFDPWLGFIASVRYYDARRNIDIVESWNRRLYLDRQWSRPDWDLLEEVSSPDDWAMSAPEGAKYYPLPGALSALSSLHPLEKEYADWLYQNRRLELFRVKDLRLESTPGETEADFMVRVGDCLRDRREQAVEKLRQQYEVKQKRLEDRLEKALVKVEKEKQDVQTKTADTLISFGTAVLGAFFGRRAFSATNIRQAATGVRGVGRVSRERGDVKRAEDEVLRLREDIDMMATEIEEKVTDLSKEYAVENYTTEVFAIKPRRADIFDLEVVLLWETV
ncbi:ATP-binding protein [Desulforhopalus vacuolatus]|uniref:ATP-binding protein n=1 Tax=Desulforhopalus vacuolatus TaxID=40414 RepID=UPI0019656683|nr:DUF87 domain-containing protein [Desulforhopalus vacuolatus]MBM9520163.1 ATP-binding protein [Desulforhopalus vacuolatus]